MFLMLFKKIQRLDMGAGDTERHKRRKAKNGQEVCIYKGANDTYTLVVEGQCPMEYQCKYDPNGKEPNIDSVVDSLNDSFK